MFSLKTLSIKTIIKNLEHPSDIYELRNILPTMLIKEVFTEGTNLITWDGGRGFEHTRPIQYIDSCEDFDEDTLIQDHFKFNISNSKSYMKWLTSACLCNIIRSSGYQMLCFHYQCDGEVTYACLKCLKMSQVV